jgi:hypothetical protein
MFQWFLPNAPNPPKDRILEPEQEELLDALTDPREEGEEHVRTIILDKIRDMMETYGLTTTHTIGKLLARFEEQVTR